MEVIKTIIHDLIGYKRETVDVARGDRGSRVVRCRLTAAGSPWEIPDGCRVQVAYELPDGTPGLYETLADGTAAGAIDGSTVDLRIAEALTRQTGVAEISGVLIGPDGDQVAIWPMRLNVVGPAVLGAPEQWPQLGAEFEGKLVFVSGGLVTPLKLGPGLSIRDGVLYVAGGAGEPDTEIPVTVTMGEEGTILVSPATLVLDSPGTITASVPVTLADDGTIIIGGDNNG